MNTLNRVVMVVLLVMLAAAVSAFCIIPHAVLREVGVWATAASKQLLGMEGWVRLVAGIGLAVLFDLAVLLFIYLELRPAPKHTIRVQNLTGGMASVGIESVVQQLQYRLDPVFNVINARPIVKAKGDKVHAVVDVTVAPGSNIPEMAARLVEVVRQTLTEELGLQVAGDPEVRLKVAAAPKVVSTPVQPRPVVAPPAPQPVAPIRPVEEAPKETEGQEFPHA
ncbi:MAG: hypothetical protein RBT47_09185 [Anaerolineae bacterium]|nr:hypothetical protein [Anaerolineae bacterium]